MLTAKGSPHVYPIIARATHHPKPFTSQLTITAQVLVTDYDIAGAAIFNPQCCQNIISIFRKLIFDAIWVSRGHVNSGSCATLIFARLNIFSDD